jgi:cytidine deaminase
MKEKELIEKAVEASLRAYAPYSGFCVGAAIEVESGKIIQGCNVENASYGLTNCAERTALFAAIAQGEKNVKRIVIYVDRNDFTPPCGACRQVINELAHEAEILLVNKSRKIKRTNITELLPLGFGSEDLKEKNE